MYEDRICCFIDILGFREHIKQSEVDEGKLQNILAILKDIEEITKTSQGSDATLSKRVTQFSDSIVISFKVDNAEEVLTAFWSILHLCIRGITRGFLFRGGISYGQLFHNDRFIFGPAIISAYDIESKAANYPRIILDRSVLDYAKSAPDDRHDEDEIAEFLNNVVSLDIDDMYYVDYISKAHSEFHNPAEDLKIYLEKIKEILSENTKVKNEGVRTKYGWLKNKANYLVASCKENSQALEALKAQGNVDLARYYEELTPF